MTNYIRSFAASSVVQEKWNKRPLMIAGPCSAETEEQVLETALRLAKNGKIDMLRAGVWKPRTRPGQFEGVGTVALSWLRTARQMSGLPVMVETATAKHVEEALAHDIDVLWIGARSTVNPFSVQEIADALRGVQIPVLVKNPINPDVELWSGAVERLEQAGLQQVGLVHRGFSSYGNTDYRNVPMWHLPLEMRRRYPEKLLLCDPSHICGRRDTLQRVAQKSIDLNFDGLMIESHPNPDAAWSDAKQQITPETLNTLLDQLIWRKSSTQEPAFTTAMNALREQINHFDDEVLLLLAQRMKVVDSIGNYKKENNITIYQRERWDDIYRRFHEKAEALGLGNYFINMLLDALHLESIRHQTKVMNDE